VKPVRIDTLTKIELLQKKKIRYRKKTEHLAATLCHDRSIFSSLRCLPFSKDQPIHFSHYHIHSQHKNTSYIELLPPLKVKKLSATLIVPSINKAASTQFASLVKRKLLQWCSRNIPISQYPSVHYNKNKHLICVQWDLVLCITYPFPHTNTSLAIEKNFADYFLQFSFSIIPSLTTQEVSDHYLWQSIIKLKIGYPLLYSNITHYLKMFKYVNAIMYPNHPITIYVNNRLFNHLTQNKYLNKLQEYTIGTNITLENID